MKFILPCETKLGMDSPLNITRNVSCLQVVDVLQPKEMERCLILKENVMVKLFRIQFMLLGGLILLISANGKATQGDARITEFQAGQIPAFLDIARHANGKVKYMNHKDAVQYCANQGAHLPSTRELAQLSTSLGAKGIVDSCGTDKNCRKIIYIHNTDDSKDEFYFSSSGYSRPAGDLGNNWFWSSSVYSGFYYPFIFDGFNGHVGGINTDAPDSSNIEAVLCVSDR